MSAAGKAADFGTVLMGTLGGLALSTVAFYSLSLRKPFGGVTPIDQNERWAQKTYDMEVDGQWPREAAGTVHMNPVRNKISGRDFALQCLKAPEDADDDDE